MPAEVLQTLDLTVEDKSENGMSWGRVLSCFDISSGANVSLEWDVWIPRSTQAEILG